MQITFFTVFVIFITLSKTENQSNTTSSSTLHKEHSDDAFTEIQCHTKARFRNITYIWNIDHFNLHRPIHGGKNPFNSPTFSSATNDKVKWYISIDPRNKTCDEISIYLYRTTDKNETAALAKYSFSFLDNEGKLLKKIESLDRFESGLYSWGWGWRRIRVNEVVSPDDSLNLVCNIAICEFTNNVVYRNRTHSILKPECNRCSDDTVPFIKNSQFSDVILVLSKTGKEYLAEKAKLAASSPVFAAMFKGFNGMGEQIRRVNITDVDEQVFDELLKYIYTNKTGNIDKIAADLLVAANKYGLGDLKLSCLKKINEKLTVGNAVDALVLAEEHGFEELKSNVIRFITANYIEVANTTNWTRIVENNRGLAPKVWKTVIQLHNKMKT